MGYVKRPPLNFLQRAVEEVEQCAQRRATAQKVKKVCLTPALREIMLWVT